MHEVLHAELRATLPALRCARAAARVLAAAARVKRLLEARAGFDPAQPRDDHGRWTVTGSSGTLVNPVEGGVPIDAAAKPKEAVRVAGLLENFPISIENEDEIGRAHV